MHREIAHTDAAFQQETNLGLYLLTALIGALIGMDLLPTVVGWLGAEAPAAWLLVGFRPAMIAAIIGGARILYTSVAALFEGRIGADLALAVATMAAILINEPLVAAEVVFIGMVGECLESITFERTQRAIRKLVEVFPRRCWLLKDGQEVRVLTTELQVGDRVVVKPGARIPVDGVVLEGRSAVDMSALTGESLPVDRGPGDEALAGSLNQYGALTIEAQRVAEKTVAGRVIELTARALKDKAPLERTADRLARYFLPVVLGLAALTFLAGMLYYGTSWFRGAEGRLPFLTAARQAVYPTLAVLVVACPCALILATPAAVIAALGRLAGTGVLIKGGSAIERLAGVTAMAFDKTGTITEGRLELGEVIGLGGVSAAELLRVAATAEQKSEHPIARLILQEAHTRKLEFEPVEDFLAHPGAGVAAKVASGRIVVGTGRLLHEQGIALTAEAQALLDKMDAAGQTALLVARDGVVLGAIGARDRVRPEVGPVLAELRALGINDILLLTGDRKAVAQTIAQDLQFSEVHAELLPDQKAQLIAQLKEKPLLTLRAQTDGSPRHRVAMVGDGINDAPALARADIGLAIGGTGTDVAAEAGDVVLMGAPLKPIPLLVRLSRETVRIIRQNIVVFAFGVNAVGILVTAWLWPLFGSVESGPLAAVIYHQLGSLAVLLNSMRLLAFERSAAEKSLVGRWRRGFRSLDSWVERHLDLGEFGHWLSHHWKTATAAAAALVVLLWALSGLTLVRPDEFAIARRFGAPVADLAPSVYWRWPWPIEDVVRVSRKIRTVEIGFRTEPQPGQAPARLAWSSVHREGLKPMADEAVMITGDGNLVDLQATVRYQVTDPRVFLFELQDADGIIRAAAESVMRGMVAGREFQDLLTISRGEFQEEARRRLERRCGEYRRGGLGIQIDGLDLHDIHPPQEVVQSYYEVTIAMEAQKRMINNALAAKEEKVNLQKAAAHKIVQEARTTFTRTLFQAKTEQANFEAWSRARNELSFDQEVGLSLRIVQDVLAGKFAPDQADAKLAEERRRLLGTQAALLDLRLYWETARRTLRNRDLVLIDADSKIKGVRNVLLLDPDQFRIPVPMFLPTDRPPRAPLSPDHEKGP